MNEVLYWIGLLFYIYSIILFARMIMSIVVGYTQYRPTGVAAMAFEFVYTLTDPPIRFLGRWIPPLNMGRVSFDLSFTVLAIVCWIVARQLMQG